MVTLKYRDSNGQYLPLIGCGMIYSAGSGIVISGDEISVDSTVSKVTTSEAASSGGTTLSLVTTGEKYAWDGKQDSINDLDTIRSGAALGATSVLDVSGKADKSSTVSSVAYNATAKKIVETINGVTTDVVTAEKLYKDSGATAYARKTDFSLNDLKSAVADGDLGKYGLKPGDLKTINGHTYIIAELNPMKGVSTPYCVTKNHVGLIVLPHTTLAWNASGNTYTGANDRGAGYMNSDLHYYLKNTVLPLVRTDLGASNLIAHSKLLSNAVNQNGYNKLGSAPGCSSSWGWESDCYISALSECLVYGAAICSSSLFDTGEACKQLEVFLHYKHTEIFRNAAGTGAEYPWLRDVVSAIVAANASYDGGANYYPASHAHDVAALILFN